MKKITLENNVIHIIYSVEVRCLQCGNLLEYLHIVNNTILKDSMLNRDNPEVLHVDFCRSCFERKIMAEKLINDLILKYINPDPHAIINPQNVVDDLQKIILEII